MGYRSDVTMIMYPKFGHRDKFAALKLYVDENLPDQFEVVGEGYDRYLHCYIDGVKWYEGYEEVDVYTRAFSEWEGTFLDEADPHGEPIFHYEFIRIGEEYEDVVYDCSYGSAHALNMSRETYIDF
jgi:hypothetical protein